ncbi:hypothetical protein [Ornithinimicrobium faecis]|uniref:hypothetical protein n=1 Tax=Ornithinimicrobium faecis TaxID=2934158 RepID=UPI0021178C9C|nr:hypothetical protein [Ornithinimicrobium sp. HY1745]
MAGKGKAAGRLIKYGPIAVTAAQRWGPVVWEQVKSQREPAEKFVQDKVAKGNQRKKAMAHAATVIDGSVLQVFHLNTAHWVVFSGDDPIAVHPPAQADFEELLDRADLSKRVLPQDSTVTVKVPRPRRRTKGATARVPRQEPATGPHTPDSPVAPGRIVRGEVTGGTEEADRQL